MAHHHRHLHLHLPRHCLYVFRFSWHSSSWQLESLLTCSPCLGLVLYTLWLWLSAKNASGWRLMRHSWIKRLDSILILVVSLRSVDLFCKSNLQVILVLQVVFFFWLQIMLRHIKVSWIIMIKLHQDSSTQTQLQILKIHPKYQTNHEIYFQSHPVTTWMVHQIINYRSKLLIMWTPSLISASIWSPTSSICMRLQYI